MSTRINLLPYRSARRAAAKRQFGLMAAAAAGAGLAVVVAFHVAIAGYGLNQQSRNSIIVAENKVLNGKIEDITRLRAEIEALKSRKDVIETLQSDRSSTVQLLDQLVRLTPEGIYLKSIKQTGSKVSLVGYAQSNELVATFMLNLEASKFLNKPQLVEIKASTVGGRRLSEFNLTAELYKVKKEAESKDTKKPASGQTAPAFAAQPAAKASDAKKN